MKNLTTKITSKVTLLIAALFLSIQSYAQLDIDVDLADDTPSLFENPMFWIGVAVVVVIVALIIGMSKKK